MPDLHVFPDRYRGLRTLQTYAGTEVSLFHLGVTAIAWARRLRLVRSPERFAGPLLAAKRRLGFLGSDVGVMFVELGGRDEDGYRSSLTWHLVARDNHGPYIPATPAIILAGKLARGEIAHRGALPCVGLLTLDDFLASWSDLAIETQLHQG